MPGPRRAARESPAAWGRREPRKCCSGGRVPSSETFRLINQRGNYTPLEGPVKPLPSSTPHVSAALVGVKIRCRDSPSGNEMAADETHGGTMRYTRVMAVSLFLACTVALTVTPA